ncbi:MAG: TonB-dependent receptor [Acidobacteria bacterium]|nr:TonB-dependent receptor [Acidobacteriota bacterium]
MKLFALLICLSFSPAAWAQSQSQAEKPTGNLVAGQIEQQQNQKLDVTVMDENGLPVISAQIFLVRAETQTVFRGETGNSGRFEFTDLTPGLYRLRVEKEGFYAASSQDVRVGQTDNVEVSLNREQEIRESLNVTHSPPAIDLSKTAASEELSSREILNIPYKSNRDYRGVLSYIPGVVKDETGQIHINGAATYQNSNQFDGFSISHPANGLLELRVSPDALRSIEVKSSRYSAEFGKGSGGVLNLTSAMGDDRFRVAVTDFIPSFQLRKGVNLNNWTPRMTFSGPLRKQKAWFFDAIDGEYNLDIIRELPSDADRADAWRLNNIAKAQVNLNQTNILTTSFLINRYESSFSGLSPFNPLEATRNLRQSAYLFTLKEQSYRSRGMLIELGFGINQYRLEERPLGDLPYVIRPGSRTGNYFKTAEGLARRLQWIANLTLPTVQWHGRHEFKMGVDFDRVTFEQYAERRPISIRRENGTVSREIIFVDSPRFSKNNYEVSGFAQDRWSVSNQWLAEIGLRLDWDAIIRRALISPRLAFTYFPRRNGETKLSAGFGFFYDSTNLTLVTHHLTGQRFDLFYTRDGKTQRGEVETVFAVNERDLRAPRFLNWSVGVEHKLPASIYMRLDFIERRGSRGFTFIDLGAFQPGQRSSLFELSSARRDRYDAVQISLRRKFKESYTLFLSYTRSAARSNAVFEMSLDNPIFSQQGGGPLPWDAPNRLISWGWMPLIKGFELSYALEWRDGYPFSLVNSDQQLVGPPNSTRFPDYFSLNLHGEKRFRLLGRHWAVRAGFNNITNRRNASSVDNNVDSSKYLTYGDSSSRALVGRIRFLGRK